MRLAPQHFQAEVLGGVDFGERYGIQPAKRLRPVFLLKENMLNVDGYEWTDLFVPLSIVAIAAAIKLIAFED